MGTTALRRFFVFVALATVASPGQPASDVGTEMHPASAQATFTMTIDGPPDPIKAGAEITVEIVLTNISDRVLSFVRPLDPAELIPMIDLRDQRGNPVALTKDGRDARASLSTMTRIRSFVQPGRKLKQDVIPLSKLYDLSQPGRYDLQLHETDRYSNAVVKSNRIAITVTR